MTDLVGRTPLFDKLVTDLARDLRAGADGGVTAEQLRYRLDPISYFTEVLKIPRHTIVWSETPGWPADYKWDGTPNPLAAVLNGLVTCPPCGGVGVESGTGTGKTFLLAGVVCWWLECWRGIVITVAPKEDQLKLHVWKELESRFFPLLHARFPRSKIGSLSLKMAPPGEAWSATGFVAGVGVTEESAAKAQGFHDPNMLFIIEETPGMKSAIMTAISNTCVSPHNLRLAVGNPDHAHDALHEFCAGQSVVAIRASALDHPNVVLDDPNIVPGAVSKQKCDERLQQYGERGNLYLSRVRGISPAQSVDSIIRREWCDAAVERGKQLAAEITGHEDAILEDLFGLPPGELVEACKRAYPDLEWQEGRGVDVAQSRAGDRAAICRGVGPACYGVETFQCEDATVLGQQVAQEIKDRGIDPDYVGVDAIGVGTSTVNELVGQQGLLVQALQSGAAPLFVLEGVEVLNARSEFWWLARLDLENGRVCLPDDPELIDDLCTPKYTLRAGKIVVERKEELRKRLGRSTNAGDAFIYWNFVRQVRSQSTTVGGAAVTF